jgi:hypothetical protein
MYRLSMDNERFCDVLLSVPVFTEFSAGLAEETQAKQPGNAGVRDVPCSG